MKDQFEEVTLKDLVELTTNEVKRDLNYVVSESKINDFKRYFEDMAIYQTIADIDLAVKVEGNPMYVTTNVATALVASDIRRKGTLEKGEKLTSRLSDLHSANTLYAKKRVQELEEDYLGMPFENKVLNTLKEVISTEDILNPVDLVKIGVCMQDRVSGYTEDSNIIANNNKIKFAKEVWALEKEKYVKNGLTNKPYYQILRDIFEEYDQKHFPLVTREAFEKVAYLTYGLDKDYKLAISDIHEFYRMNDASRLIDIDVIDDYREGIEESFGSYKDRHTGKAKTR